MRFFVDFVLFFSAFSNGFKALFKALKIALLFVQPYFKVFLPVLSIHGRVHLQPPSVAVFLLALKYFAANDSQTTSLSLVERAILAKHGFYNNADDKICTGEMREWRWKQLSKYRCLRRLQKHDYKYNLLPD